MERFGKKEKLMENPNHFQRQTKLRILLNLPTQLENLSLVESRKPYVVPPRSERNNVPKPQPPPKNLQQRKIQPEDLANFYEMQIKEKKEREKSVREEKQEEGVELERQHNQYTHEVRAEAERKAALKKALLKQQKEHLEEVRQRREQQRRKEKEDEEQWVKMTTTQDKNQEQQNDKQRNKEAQATETTAYNLQQAKKRAEERALDKKHEQEYMQARMISERKQSLEVTKEESAKKQKAQADAAYNLNLVSRKQATAAQQKMEEIEANMIRLGRERQELLNRQFQLLRMKGIDDPELFEKVSKTGGFDFDEFVSDYQDVRCNESLPYYQTEQTRFIKAYQDVVPPLPVTRSFLRSPPVGLGAVSASRVCAAAATKTQWDDCTAERQSDQQCPQEVCEITKKADSASNSNSLC